MPPAAYVSLIPFFPLDQALRRLPSGAVLGFPGLVLFAWALWWLESRRSRRYAAAVLLGVVGTAVVAIAVGAQVLGALICAAFMMVAAHGYGRLLHRWLRLGDDGGGWQQVPFRIASGWTVLLVLGLAAGLLRVLTGGVVVVLCAVGMGLSFWPPAYRDPHTGQAAGMTDGPAVFWWWGLILLMLTGFVGAVLPEVRHDALAAHLPIAREFASQHAIVEMRHNTASYFQLNADLLHAMGMTLVPGESLPKLLHFFAGVTASLVVYGLGARLSSPRVALAAAAVVAGTPMVWWVGGSAYTDLWVVLFATALIAAVARHVQLATPGSALLTGLLAGAALGTKVPAVVVVAPAVLLMVVHGVKSPSVKHRWLTVGMLIAGAMLTGVFWYDRAGLLTGNPLFPLFNRLLRSPYASSFHRAVARDFFGMGTSVWDLILLPWRVTRFPGRFVEDGTIGAVYLAMLPASIVAVVAGRAPRWLGGIAVVSALLWAFTAQYLRFLLPILPLAALLGAAGFFGQNRQTARQWPAAAVLAAMLALAAWTWISPGPPNFSADVVLGRMSRQEYLERHVAGIRVAAHAARALPPSARILSVGESLGLHYGRFFVPDNWYGRVFRPGLRGDVLRIRTGRDMQRLSRQMGFTHLVVQPGRFGRRARRTGSWVAREAFWEEGPRLVYADAGRYLFDLAGAHGPVVRARRLYTFVPPVAAGGERASPAVAVEPNTLHALEAQIRAVSSVATVEMTIRWAAADGRVLEPATTRRIEVNQRKTRYAVASTSPPQAHSAIIRLAAGDGSAVEFTDAEFYTLR